MASGTMHLTLQIAAGGPSNSETLQAMQLTFNSLGAHEQAAKTTINTTEETITIDAEITASDVGFVWLRNIDPTNPVQFGFATTVYPFKFKPGDAAFFRSDPDATSFFAKFGGSAGLLLYRIWQS